jgi:regulator of sigma E protease
MEFNELLQFIASALGALLVFGITIFVHELGHFLAARRHGLVVERFAIGFGPKIFSLKRGGVEYSVNWIPFGGYVALPQMSPMEMVEGKNEQSSVELPPIRPWSKIVVAFWGPLFSFLLALFCATVLFFLGSNYDASLETTTIGYVQPGSPADQAGLRPGDRILALNGEPMQVWSRNGGGAVLQGVLLSVGRTIAVEYERAGERQKVDLVPVPNPELEGLRTLGFEQPECRQVPLVIDRVGRDSPAQEAGLRIGDRILTVEGQTVHSPLHFKDLIDLAPAPVTLGIERAGQPRLLQVQPRLETTHNSRMIGIKWRGTVPGLRHVAPFEQVESGILTMGQTLGALVNPQSGVKAKHLSGAVGIFEMIRNLLSKDLRDLLWFCVFFNVNLAVLNLLPLPILDGGHIFFALLEWSFRRPVNLRVQTALNTMTFVLLVAFMLYVTFYDIARQVRRHQRSGSEASEKVPDIDELKFER